jgi:hypothetical protein
VAEVEVPPAAVEAATDRVYQGQQLTAAHARAVLRPAAPHIAADTLRQAAQELCRAFPSSVFAVEVGAWLRRSADDLDGHQPTPDTREGILAAARLTEADMAKPAPEVPDGP